MNETLKNNTKSQLGQWKKKISRNCNKLQERKHKDGY